MSIERREFLNALSHDIEKLIGRAFDLQIEGTIKSHTSEYGKLFNNFSFVSNKNSYDNFPQSVQARVLRKAVLAALEEWFDWLKEERSGAARTIVWRVRPELSTELVESEYGPTISLKLRARAHLLSSEEVTKGPIEPVENTA